MTEGGTLHAVLGPLSLHHVGIVVGDIDAAAERYAQLGFGDDRGAGGGAVQAVPAHPGLCVVDIVLVEGREVGHGRRGLRLCGHSDLLGQREAPPP